MSTWNEHQRRPEIVFRTPAPADAPEVKGYRAYFQPETLEWHVRHGDVRVMASGPTTRAPSLGRGEMWWSVQGGWGDERPDWLLPPNDLLAHAVLAVDDLDERVTQEWRKS